MDTGKISDTLIMEELVGKNYPEIKMRNKKTLLIIRALRFWNAF